MTTQQVADRFYELAKENKYDIIVKELYANDAESIEPSSDFGPKHVQGLGSYGSKV